MILELGHFALALAFVCSLMQAALPLVARRYDGEYLARAVIGFSRAQFALVALAFAALTAAFVDSDFRRAMSPKTRTAACRFCIG